MAIGLSPAEMKNLGVDSGQILEVIKGGKKVMASVYKVEGALAPAKGTVNLSVAAARKLLVKSGQMVTVQMPGATSMPTLSKKKSSMKFTKK